MDGAALFFLRFRLIFVVGCTDMHELAQAHAMHTSCIQCHSTLCLPFVPRLNPEPGFAINAAFIGKRTFCSCYTLPFIQHMGDASIHI